MSDELNGCVGPHQYSVDIPSPMSPSASTEEGNSSALPTDAIFGTNPCWFACFQKFVKSGGIGTPVRIWAFAFLYAEICALKSCVPSSYRPGSTIV